jgi:hypothetical protein
VFVFVVTVYSGGPLSSVVRDFYAMFLAGVQFRSGFETPLAEGLWQHTSP